MIDFNTAIELVRRNGGFKPNRYGDSFYRLYNTGKGIIQVRISNHGTELWTWVKNAPIDPSKCIANIAIVFSEYGYHNSNTSADMRLFKEDSDGNSILDKTGKKIVVGMRDNFEVIQYVYNLSLLSNSNIAAINKQIQRISSRGDYYEPYQKHKYKHAGVYKLEPNKNEQVIIPPMLNKDRVPQNIGIDNDGTSNVATKYGHGADFVSENKQYNKNTNMKQVIRLTESELHQIIKESIKKVLSESNGKGEKGFWGNKGLPYGFQDDEYGNRIHVNHKGKIDGWNNGEYGHGRIESQDDIKRHRRETDGWKDQYADDKSYIQSKGKGKNKQWRSVPRSNRGLNEDAYVNDIIAEYGNPPYTAYCEFGGFWGDCNDPNYLEDYMIRVDNYYSATMGECGKTVIYNGDGEIIFSLG